MPLLALLGLNNHGGPGWGIILDTVEGFSGGHTGIPPIPYYFQCGGGLLDTALGDGVSVNVGGG